MNINDDLNNRINPNRQADRTQNARSGDRVRTTKQAVSADTATQTGETQTTEQVQDTVNLSGGTQYVEDLTSTAEQQMDEPREDVVARVSARVAAGEYDSPAFIRDIAESLLDSTLPTD